MVVRLGGGSMGQAGRQSVRIVRWAHGASSQVGTLCQQAGGAHGVGRQEPLREGEDMHKTSKAQPSG